MRLAVSARGRAGTAIDRQCVTGTRKIGVVEDATFPYLLSDVSEILLKKSVHNSL